MKRIFNLPLEGWIFKDEKKDKTWNFKSDVWLESSVHNNLHLWSTTKLRKGKRDRGKQAEVVCDLYKQKTIKHYQSREGNGSDLDRVQLDPNPDLFSSSRPRSGMMDPMDSVSNLGPKRV